MTIAMSLTASPSSATAWQEVPSGAFSSASGSGPRRHVRGPLASAVCGRPGSRRPLFCGRSRSDRLVVSLDELKNSAAPLTVDRIHANTIVGQNLR
jgi:hypothetical protein